MLSGPSYQVSRNRYVSSDLNPKLLTICVPFCKKKPSPILDMPIQANDGVLDIENATLRSNAIVTLTNLVAGNDVVRVVGAPTLEVYGDPNNGGTEPTLELVSNVNAGTSSAFSRLTSNAGVFTIQSGINAGTDSKGDIAFTSIDGTTEHMRIQGSTSIMQISGHIIPTTNAAFDVGSADYKIRDIFVDNNSMWVGDAAKIAFSGGKMKFKRRKLNKTPKFVKELAIAHSIPGVTDEATAGAAAVTYLQAHFPSDGIGTLADLKLQHWKAYTKSIDATKELSDIFADNDEDYEVQSAAEAWSEVGSNVFSTHSVTVGATTEPRSDLDVVGTGSIIIPVGTTGERPSTGVLGMIRYNSDTGSMEVYTVDEWNAISTPPTVTAISPTIITATGNYLEGFYHQKDLRSPDPQSSDQFGWSVSISADGTRAIVGARYDDQPGGATSNPGNAYIYTRAANSDFWVYEARLMHPTITNTDYFGWSVSMSDDGNRVIVGVQRDDVPTDTGSAQIYVRDVNGVWTWEDELRNPLEASSDYFGSSVDISGDGTRAIVGAYYDDHSTTGAGDTGSAHIFVRDATTTPISWTHEKELRHEGVTGQTVNASDQFGWSVSISTDGSLVIVGAHYSDSTPGDSGSAYVFRRVVTDWVVEQRLLHHDPQSSDYFGSSVAISGDGTRVIVGAYGDDDTVYPYANTAGSAQIYRRDTTTNPISWVYEKSIRHTTSMQAVNASDTFGWSVSISNDGNRVIAGAKNTNLGGGNAGSAYIFDRTTGTNDWTFNKMLVHPSPTTNDYFGQSVAISGDGTYTICGAYADDNPTGSGSAQVFNFKSQLDDTSTQVFTATGTGITDRSIVQLEGQNGTLYNVFDVTTPNAAGTEITFKMGSLGASGGYNRAQQPYKVKITAASSISGTSTAMIKLTPVWTTASVNFLFSKSSSKSFTLVAKDGANVSSSGSWAGTFSVVSANLPPGLTLNPSTGVLLGTIDAGYNTLKTGVTFRVTDNVNLLFTDRVFVIDLGMYEFSGHTFTNAGATGRTGPTLAQLRSAYDVPWEGTLSVTGSYGGIQEWTVPGTGSYRIEAYGAKSEWGDRSGSSSYRGGYGARMRGDFTLTAGEIIQILVGQNGVNATHTQNTGQPGIGAGGGGTFVIRTPYTNTGSILVIAGGGGGGAQNSWTNRRGEGGNTGTSGTGGGSSNNNQSGGSGGNGGNSQYAGGGAGFTGNGANPSASSDPSRSFTNGGRGGQGGRSHGGPEFYGGFGGGGGAGGLSSGGGGGYSGGGSGTWSSEQDGGGGGSYNNGSNQSNTADTNNGHGKVIITPL